jgi:hypothetical protein
MNSVNSVRSEYQKSLATEVARPFLKKEGIVAESQRRN